MASFVIHTHGRLQEWVTEEKGYFAAEGLTDYRLAAHGLLSATHTPARARANDTDNRHGAYQTYEQGRDASVSCACHWTVNMAAAADFGRLWGDCYTVTPCGVFVPPASTVRSPEDLEDVAVHVGYQSGSHYTTIQALEPFLPLARVRLVLGGSPADRVDRLLAGVAPAATVFGAQYYLMEQLGFHDRRDGAERCRSGQRPPLFRRVAAGAGGYRRVASALRALLRSRTAGTTPRAGRCPPVRPRRAVRVRALHAGHV